MRFFHLFYILTCIATLTGCAQGGARRNAFDAGLPPTTPDPMLMDAASPGAPDSGMSSVDAGMPSPTDSGVTGPADSGTTLPDSGPACPESPCRLVSPQCGCPAGQGCYPSSPPGRACAAAGTVAEGQLCGSTNCQPGLGCLGPDTSSALCYRFCNTDTDCTGGAGSSCVIALNDASGNPTDIRSCTVHCDIATSSGCPSSTACRALEHPDTAGRIITDCLPSGSGGRGSSCTSTSDCQAGFACLDLGFGNECAELCERPPFGACTNIFALCTAFSTPLTIGSIEYGVCN